MNPTAHTLRPLLSGFHYRQCYLILYAGALSLGLARIFPSFLIAVVLIAVPTIVAALFLTVTAMFRAMQRIFVGQQQESIAHLAAIVVGIVAGFFGFLSASILALAFVVPQLNSAVTAYREGQKPTNDDIEIISADPAIASYRTGYLAGFAAPGVTKFIVIDQTGQFAGHASSGHARDLAGSADLKSQKYKSYCYLDLTHAIGPYYFASAYDVDGCEYSDSPEFQSGQRSAPSN
jgi:hypothetical protein